VTDAAPPTEERLTIEEISQRLNVGRSTVYRFVAAGWLKIHSREGRGKRLYIAYSEVERFEQEWIPLPDAARLLGLHPAYLLVISRREKWRSLPTRPTRLYRADLLAYTPRRRGKSLARAQIDECPDVAQPEVRRHWLTTAEAQALLGISAGAVGRWATKENWRCFRRGRQYYYARADVEAHQRKIPPENSLTIESAASRAGKSRQVIRNWIETGRLPAQKVRGRWYILVPDLDRARMKPSEGRTQIEPQSVMAALDRASPRLSAREQEILRLRYTPGRQLTQDEIGKSQDLTRERVRQIERAGLIKLGLAQKKTSGHLLCPICGKRLRRFQTSPTLYVCARAQREIATGADGQVRRTPGARHAEVRLWKSSELSHRG
jgi:RNA polymerase sigma factor (sigma-70 family)